MAEEVKIQSAFPAPPPFWKNFTKENLEELRKRQTAASQSQQTSADESADGPKSGLDILSLPPELRCLIPPPPPADGKYASFGVQHDLNAPEPTLADSGVDMLVADDDPNIKLNPQPWLIRMAQSLLTTFLALTGILAQNPELQDDKIKDLQTIVYNMHHLINLYRPHQARETLILIMEERIESMKDEIRQIGEAKEKLRGILEGFQVSPNKRQKREVNGEHGVGDQLGSSDTETRVAKQLATWQALDDELAANNV